MEKGGGGDEKEGGGGELTSGRNAEPAFVRAQESFEAGPIACQPRPARVWECGGEQSLHISHHSLHYRNHCRTLFLNNTGTKNKSSLAKR